MSSNRRNRKARSNDPKPASKDAIEKNYTNFIRALPHRYKSAQDVHKRSIYRFLTECEILAELAEDDEDIADELRNGEFWSAHRQKCFEDEYVKLVVHHMMEPGGKTQQSKASKYVAVIEYLRTEGLKGPKLFERLNESGGIRAIYADATGLTAKRAMKANSERGNRIQELDYGTDEDLEQTAEEGASFEALEWVELGVLVKPETRDKILDEKEDLLQLKIGGKPVPGKPKGYIRVTGKVYKGS